MSNLIKYFSYGSNMSLAQTRERLGRVPARVVAELPEYALAFNKPMYHDHTHAYANVVPAAGNYVLGVLYDCTEADMASLDVVEGVAAGHYGRQRVTVEVGGQSVDATVYVGCADRVGNVLPTTDEYLHSILAGARDNDFPDHEVARILQAAGRVQS